MSLQASSPHEVVASISPEMISKLKDVSIILLFGPSGSGKTSFANVASSSSMKVGNGVKSSTQQVEFSNIFRVDDKPVVVVDCPGFDDTYLSEIEILQCLVGFLTAAYSNNLKITGLIYMHRIIDPRVGGSSFRHMNMFKAMCGAESLKNAVYVTNMWSEPPTENEIRREAELRYSEEFFGGPLAGGARMARHVETRESAHDIIRLMLDKDSTVTKLQRQLVDEGMKLEDTDAGLLLGEDLESALSQHRQDMEELNAQQGRALELNNQEWIKRLEAQAKKTEERGRQLSEQLKSLKGGKQPEPTTQRLIERGPKPEPTTQRPVERVPNPRTTPSGVTDMMAGFQKMMEDLEKKEEQRRAGGLAAERKRQELLDSRAAAFVKAAFDIPHQSRPVLNLPPSPPSTSLPPLPPLPSFAPPPSQPPMSSWSSSPSTYSTPPFPPPGSRRQTMPAPKNTQGHRHTREHEHFSGSARLNTASSDPHIYDRGHERIQDDGIRRDTSRGDRRGNPAEDYHGHRQRATSSRGNRRGGPAEDYHGHRRGASQGRASQSSERVSWDQGPRRGSSGAENQEGFFRRCCSEVMSFFT